MAKTYEEKTGLAFWAPMVAAALALFIVVVDSTMMNVAVPTIVKDLHWSHMLFCRRLPDVAGNDN